MYLRVQDIHDILEKRAPSILKESYDNVGLMVGDMKCEVGSILVALDCTLEVIEEALRNNCNLIFTHHPLLFKRPYTITTDTLIGKKIIELIRNNINVYSSHTNLDSVKGGINDIIMEKLGLTNHDVIEPSRIKNYGENDCGIGRIASLTEPMTLARFCNEVKKCLNISSVRYSGNELKIINKVALINGSGQDYFDAAKALGADCVITGDTTYHYVSDFQEQGIAVIDAGHFGTEWPAMEIIANFLRHEIKVRGFENTVILSKVNKSPYKYK
ncbi:MULTISPECIES: Nif3-like dinuclear metal center hexameric protein [Clostridium]|uniref:GTP cyclohydrolase 1 type 2 homolog n=3 Tax=Clostridium TaxID=1485 RepID=D8GPI4_CLOLD|nr:MULTISPECIES: Nif3-like dinuclear metal center hexameric protein [Clostridium]ADK13893.1 putative NGG1p interacting factor 3 [Clostridium ljungdahlii DSM 13528]AGY77125.1 Nif3-like dinuclear metal center hexameric protein [Clostridium autoethanogenum DSM 10061]ALU37267.1 NGG1p interacting factor 3 protein [Clostridium autoethanogenum DSM 10061]OAA87383.1 putative GTP cyclohydrolase 1 type 2 [Clostridium ljungdahlii DSM 13528]OVY50165.1 putative GTP cyclohydrolase 1 type 2 [Clostridium autoe